MAKRRKPLSHRYKVDPKITKEYSDFIRNLIIRGKTNQQIIAETRKKFPIKGVTYRRIKNTISMERSKPEVQRKIKDARLDDIEYFIRGATNNRTQESLRTSNLPRKALGRLLRQAGLKFSDRDLKRILDELDYQPTKLRRDYRLSEVVQPSSTKVVDKEFKGRIYYKVHATLVNPNREGAIISETIVVPSRGANKPLNYKQIRSLVLKYFDVALRSRQQGGSGFTLFDLVILESFEGV